MRAVIYARFSSENQREESIEGQLRECKAFAERKGYTIVKTYADRAISGKHAENRPEFMQMIHDSSKGEFDAVIVWKIDRFSRDKYDSVVYKSILLKNAVSVMSATEPIDGSAEGKLMESIFEGFSEYYVKDLEVKVCRGMTENTLKGKFNGGSVTFGYMIDADNMFQPDPYNAPVVTDIFTRYSVGESIIDILNDLKSKGITNREKPLTYHFINWILKNRRYLGEYSFRGTVNYNAIPPLTTPDVFELCQKRLSDNKHKPASFRKVEEKYLLTGKIFCGHCGDTMSGVSGYGRDRVYRYYQCMTSKRKRCDKKRTSKDFIENIVLEQTMAIFEDKTAIKRIIDTCYDAQRTKSPHLAVLKKRLKENQKELDNLMNAIKKWIVTKSTKRELEKLEEEQETLEISIAQEKLKSPVIDKEHIRMWISQFAKTDLNSNEQKQELIDIFINSIYVYDDRMLLMFNYKGGEKSLTFDELESCLNDKNTHKSECSSLFKSGDPYGNRKSPRTFCGLS